MSAWKVPRKPMVEAVPLEICFACGSEIGPFLFAPDGLPQVICSTCGARGPYQTRTEAAETRWNKLIRQDHYQALVDEIERLRDALGLLLEYTATICPDAEPRKRAAEALKQEK